MTKHFTWKQLAEKIGELSEEQRNTDVTIRDKDCEYLPAVRFMLSDEETNDILDDGHPYLAI